MSCSTIPRSSVLGDQRTPEKLNWPITKNSQVVTMAVTSEWRVDVNIICCYNTLKVLLQRKKIPVKILQLTTATLHTSANLFSVSITESFASFTICSSSASRSSSMFFLCSRALRDLHKTQTRLPICVIWYSNDTTVVDVVMPCTDQLACKQKCKI